MNEIMKQFEEGKNLNELVREVYDLKALVILKKINLEKKIKKLKYKEVKMKNLVEEITEILYSLDHTSLKSSTHDYVIKRLKKIINKLKSNKNIKEIQKEKNDNSPSSN